MASWSVFHLFPFLLHNALKILSINNRKRKFLFFSDIYIYSEVGIEGSIKAGYVNKNIELPYPQFSLMNNLIRIISSFNGGINYSQFGANFNFISTKFTNEEYEDYTKSATIYGALNFEQFAARHEILFNLSLRNDSIYGMFGSILVEDKFRLDSFLFNAGVRIDGPRFSPLLRIFYEIDNTILGVEYKPFLEYKNFSDFYDLSPYTEVNKDLNPAYYFFLISGSINHKFIQWLSCRLAVNLKNVKNFVVWNDRNKNRLFSPENIPEVSILELEVTPKFQITKDISGSIGYIFTKIAESPVREDEFIPFIPEHKARLNFFYTPDTWNIKYEIEFIGERYFDREISDKLNSFFLMNFEISKEIFSGFTLNLLGRNLLNLHYEKWVNYPEPLARFIVDIKILF